MKITETTPKPVPVKRTFTVDMTGEELKVIHTVFGMRGTAEATEDGHDPKVEYDIYEAARDALNRKDN